MKRHVAIDLWGYAARELALEDAKYTEAHLLDCPECQAALSKVQKAQGVLFDARLAQPRLALARADAALAREISRRLLKKAKPVRWGLWLTPAAVAALALVAVAVRQWPVAAPQAAAPQESAAAAAPEPAPPAALVRSRDGRQAVAGETLSTGARGAATFALPDTSRLRLAASSRLQVARASARAVELELLKGRVAVHAAHVPREAFTVRASDVTVHVLGTTFAVSRGSEFVEVAVSEGRVGVESPRGLPFFVSAGERVRVGLKSWRPASRAIGSGLRDELEEVAPAVPAAGGAAVQAGPPPPPPPPLRASEAKTPTSDLRPPTSVVPLVVTPLEREKVGAPVPAPSEWEQLPQQSRAPVGLRGIAEPNPPGQEARPGSEAPVAAPAAAPPTAPAPAPAASGAVPAAGGAAGNAGPSTPPAAPASAPAPAPAPEVRGPMPEDLEELFLMRAERALRNGGCDRYLLGLADIAEDPQRTVRQERARIAIARCHQALGQHEAAAAEFARYARDFPKGLFAREAAAAIAARP